MKPYSLGILCLCCSLYLFLLSPSCRNAAAANDKEGRPGGISPDLAGKMEGVYAGSFDKGMITLVLNYINGKNVSGYNIHKGLRRNVNGTVFREGDHLNFLLKEPGDNQFDGTFTFSLDTLDRKISGKWIPLDSSTLKAKKIVLSRKLTSENTFDDDQYWTMTGQKNENSSLSFNEDGSCELSFYENAADSTSQLITVRGSYEKKTDTFRVEWQKNKYTPAQNMKLVKSTDTIRETGQKEHLIPVLKGQGWRLIPNFGD